MASPTPKQQASPKGRGSPNEEVGRITHSAVRDTPAKDDQLGFKPYVEAIAAFLDSPGTQPPITLSLEGEWGSGKSSFMRQLQETLNKPGRSPSIVVSFNAWRFDKQDAMWAAFALAVTRSLRKECRWLDRQRGDTKLFFQRINGLTGWLHILQFLAAWLLFLTVCVFALFYLARHPAIELPFIRALFPDTSQHGEIPPFYSFLLKSGAWTGAAAILIAALSKSGKLIRGRLFDFKLEKLIARPDYASHTAFIEEFHADFAKTIRAYAGNRKVYVFVDDLDRCDLPKAAELMQAINLMIGEDDHLVFILGLDRDKVAAAIAAKYKDLLPFLRKTNGDLSTMEIEERLAFGYEYLEKFIQISFRVPLPDKESVIQHFIEKLTPDEAKVDDPVVSARKEAAAEQRARFFRRIDSGKDSKRVIDVVLMVRHLLGNNPRRLKQFLNAYRLSLYLASSQGLLDTDAEADLPKLTLEQLGKLVALVMRFPRLPRLLLDNPKLLQEYERNVTGEFSDHPTAALPGWMQGAGVEELLRFGVGPGSPTPVRYSLLTMDVLTVLQVMPTVPKPDDTPPRESASQGIPDVFGQPLSSSQARPIRVSANQAPPAESAPPEPQAEAPPVPAREAQTELRGAFASPSRRSDSPSTSKTTRPPSSPPRPREGMSKPK